MIKYSIKVVHTSSDAVYGAGDVLEHNGQVVRIARLPVSEHTTRIQGD